MRSPKGEILSMACPVGVRKTTVKRSTQRSSKAMTDSKVFYPPDRIAEKSFIQTLERYNELYKDSVEKPEKFWGEIAKQFHWETPIDPKSFLSFNFDIKKGKIETKWMQGATTNICYNLLDRNVKKGNGDKVAYYWEGNDPDDYSRLTYKKLLEEVCRFSNVLKKKGVGKGDRVGIYMPMILELPIAMLACARIGAVHSIVFAGFSSDSLAERMCDCKCKLIITADVVWRGEKRIELKKICDAALEKCKVLGHAIKTCIVVHHSDRLAATSALNGVKNGNGVSLRATSTTTVKSSVAEVVAEIETLIEGRDFWWHELMEVAEPSCYPEWMDAEAPLFMLYTSGSTGKPKGVLHTIGGYLLYAATTFKYVFNYYPQDIFWCTADIGWITGHTYVVYGPLANCATSVIFEGTPFYPENDRFWKVVEKYKVNQFYTAPTALRSLMKYGDEPVKKHNLSSLRILGSVGEPINEEAWLWYYNVVGGGKCSIVDTFWQTETGGHVLTPLPGCTPMKPGSATFPFFGVVPVLLNESGEKIVGPGEGYLVFDRPWPGMMRTLFGNHERYESTYFSKFPGYYCTGDGARRDKDGYFWVTGRVDDMLNVSGHLMSTSEVESVLTEHPEVSEAAVVSKPHVLKGECLYCFVTPMSGVEFTKTMVDQLKNRVREKIGPFATPDTIQYAPALPKTRSGKIMRRILRKIAVNDRDIGDTSTLMDPKVIEMLFKYRPADK